MLQDLRESGQIEQDADIVLMLYRENYYNEQTGDKNEHWLRDTREIRYTTNG